MADQPLLTDDAALTYAEHAVNGMRAFQNLAEVVRYVKGTRAAIPQLKDEYQALRAKVDAAKADLAAEAKRAETERGQMVADMSAARSDFKAANEARTAAREEVRQLTRELEKLRADIEKAEEMLQDRNARVAQLATHQAELEKAVSILTAQRESYKKAAAAV